jgi:hypothetical protein
MSDLEWFPTRWQLRGDWDGFEPRPVVIERTNGPFYTGERYVVRWLDLVLNVHNEWEWEPSPSQRDDAFYARCRFISFASASAAAEKASKPS